MNSELRIKNDFSFTTEFAQSFLLCENAVVKEKKLWFQLCENSVVKEKLSTLNYQLSTDGNSVVKEKLSTLNYQLSTDGNSVVKRKTIN